MRKELAELRVHIVHEPNGKVLTIQPTLLEQIKQDQKRDEGIQKVIQHISREDATPFQTNEEGILRYKDRLVIPREGKMREIILDEAHSSAYSIHPGATKMFKDLSQNFWWKGMKADVANHVA